MLVRQRLGETLHQQFIEVFVQDLFFSVWNLFLRYVYSVVFLIQLAFSRCDDSIS